MVESILGLKYSVFSEVEHPTDPYRRLFSEIVSYLETKTQSGGELEGFFIYKNQPKNEALHFPCIIVEMELGDTEHLFSSDYKEHGALTFKIMFTKKHVIILDKL